MDYLELVRRARAAVPEVAADESLLDGRIVLIDVRELHERDAGHIPGDLAVPRSLVESRIEELVPDRGTPIVLYCSVGQRSLLAGQSLRELGYRDVASLAGGFEAWRAAGLPWEAPQGLDTAQRIRYDRHLRLPGFGVTGQLRLGATRVLVVGAGGLGSPAALYLAAAGVGTLGVVDDDTVELSNLQRQILHATDRVGHRKVDSARATLEGLNPEVKVETHPVRLTPDNAAEIVTGYDLVVDGADNLPTRYLLNDVTLRLGVPVVHGSVYRYEGQVTVFSPGQGPCYRCLYPEAPPPELAPACAEAGVVGALPGVVGSLQAMEVIKLAVGVGRPLVGRLLVLDLASGSFDVLATRRDPSCPACGDQTA